ncbi:MAG: hypothetical protein ACI9V8_000737 [Urechidicola sp.]|jgi:hypothetical protein
MAKSGFFLVMSISTFSELLVLAFKIKFIFTPEGCSIIATGSGPTGPTKKNRAFHKMP